MIKKESKKWIRTGLIIYFGLVIAALLIFFLNYLSDKAALSGDIVYPSSVSFSIRSGDVDLSVDDINYTKTISLDSDGNGYTFYPADDSSDAVHTEPGKDSRIINADVVYNENVSGNGENFVKILSDGGYKDITDDDRMYSVFKLYFKTSEKLDIYLDKNSFVSGLEDILSGTDRKCEAGNFSLDAATGAIRVSFTEENASGNVLKNIWIPNDGYRLVTEENGQSFELSCERIKRESVTGYCYFGKNGSDYSKKSYSGDDYASGKITVGSETLAASYGSQAENNLRTTAGLSVPLLSFEGGKEQTKVLCIRVWYEGTDREASEILKGGMAKCCFAFTAVSKDLPQITLLHSEDFDPETFREPQENERYVYYNETTGKLCFYTDKETYNTNKEKAIENWVMLYSFDGIEWQNYNAFGISGNIYRSSEKQVLYARIPEKLNELAGESVKISIPGK